ncbi:MULTISPECIES: hypothetical protein [unclassified Legionella]|uniref:hypothetical protein n=2 Tax=unclassified Legionella TaxID=2622702 RepID=UPI001E4C920B|nr:hypothetical protein [Legionella sp. 31fI33]MCC5014993.1 hypothetical protein [Legionella sp. 31fI33]
MMDVVVNSVKEDAPDGSKPLVSYGHYYLNFLSCLGYDPIYPPLADLLRLSHHLEGKWVIASPIHWQATHNDAMVVATGEELELTEEESLLWFAELEQFLKEDDFSPVYHDAQTWLFNIDSKPVFSSKSVYAMQHQSMMPALEAMDNTLFWLRLITELQMYLSSHPLNQQRQNKLAINGLWFWGPGEFKLPKNRKIATDDKVLLVNPCNQLEQITLYTPDSVIQKNDLLLLKYPQQFNLAMIEANTKNITTHWFWNNMAYTKQKSRWWSRLWR